MTKQTAVEEAKAKALELAKASSKAAPKAASKAAPKAPAKAKEAALTAKEAKEAQDAKEAAKLEAESKKALGRIAKRITTLGKQVAERQLAIGVLLLEAKGWHSTAKAFVSWSEETLGYKKAYTYRLISVAEKFGDVEDFAGVAIRVLHILSGLPEEVQEAAKDIAKAGALDTEMVNALKDAVQGKQEEAPKPAKDTDKELEDAVLEEKEALRLEEEENSAIDTLFDKPEPVQLPRNKPKEEDNTDNSQSLDFSSEDTAPWDNEVLAPSLPVQDGVLEDRLLTIIAGLQEELAQAKKQSLPTLPQFSNDNLAARLGLSEEQAKDKKQVRAAYNALVQLGYGVQHSSHALLADALKGLLAQA